MPNSIIEHKEAHKNYFYVAITSDYRKNPMEVHQYILRKKSRSSFIWRNGIQTVEERLLDDYVEYQLCREQTYGDET